MGHGSPLLPLVLLLGLGPAAPESVDWVPPPPPSAPARAPLALHPRILSALQKALWMAEEKLSSPQCREIFQDFSDPSGRPLGRILDETGRDGAFFLRDLEFADGSATQVCATRQNLAWTYLNGRTIYLCGLEFASTAHTNPRFVANLLIHEGLHSLGLGENPPSSTEITSRVGEKCGY